MDIVGKKVESQVQFWSLLGPFFVLLSIAVLLFKVSPHWYIPLSALIGIPLCVRFKMMGMAIALGCLFLLAGIHFQNLELDDRYWHVGLSLAIAFSFIVLTLSLEEVQGLVNKLQLESQSRLDNFQLLDDKWKTAELEWLSEKERTKEEVKTLTQELTGIQEDKQTFYKLAQLSKEELVQVRGQHDQLLQDLLYKKQQIAQLYERLEETELTIQNFVNSDSEKQIQVLTERISCLDRDKEIFKAKMTSVQEERQTCQIEKDRLNRELEAYQEREQLYLIEQHRYTQDKQDQQNAMLSIQNKCVQLEQEKQKLLQFQQQNQREVKAIQEEYQKLDAELLKAQQDLETTQTLLNQSNQKKEEYQANIEMLQFELEAIREDKSQQFKNDQEKQKNLIQEITDLKEKSQAVQQNLEQVQHELEMSQQVELQQLQDHQEKQEILHQELHSLKEKYQAIKQNLVQAQHTLKENEEFESQQLKNYQEKQKELIQEVAVLKESCQSKQQELDQTVYDLELKNEALEHLQKKMQQLSHELGEQQLLFKSSCEHNQKLDHVKLQLEQALHQAHTELQETKKKLESKQEFQKEQVSPSHTRRAESMYKQLRAQFQEKCQVLDATRRELFCVNEELLKCKKEYEEEHLYDQTLNEKHLQRHLNRLSKQFDQMQLNYQQEIDDLNQLVVHLLQQIR